MTGKPKLPTPNHAWIEENYTDEPEVLEGELITRKTVISPRTNCHFMLSSLSLVDPTRLPFGEPAAYSTVRPSRTISLHQARQMALRTHRACEESLQRDRTLEARLNNLGDT